MTFCISLFQQVYSEEELTSMISFVTAIGQIGLLVGPCLNFALIHVDFTVWGFSVDSLNVPGLLERY